MNKAVFLDRDGILNEERGVYISSIKEFTILSDVIPALKILQQKGYLSIVITNQGGIAKGLYTEQELVSMHTYLCKKLAEEAIQLNEIYYCPHHPDFSGKCLCRKPESVLIEKALARFDIDPSLSYFIGDRDRDIQAAERAGVKGILLQSNQSLLDALPSIN